MTLIRCTKENCNNNLFEVDQSDLDYAEGVLECEYCGEDCITVTGITKDEMIQGYGIYRNRLLNAPNIRVFEEGPYMLILIELTDNPTDPTDEIHIEWITRDAPMYFKDELWALKDPTAKEIVKKASEFTYHSIIHNGNLIE